MECKHLHLPFSVHIPHTDSHGDGSWCLPHTSTNIHRALTSSLLLCDTPCRTASSSGSDMAAGQNVSAAVRTAAPLSQTCNMWEVTNMWPSSSFQSVEKEDGSSSSEVMTNEMHSVPTTLPLAVLKPAQVHHLSGGRSSQYPNGETSHVCRELWPCFGMPDQHQTIANQGVEIK